MNTVLGVLGIITTVLVTFSTHFDFNGLSESHRVGLFTRTVLAVVQLVCCPHALLGLPLPGVSH